MNSANIGIEKKNIIYMLSPQKKLKILWQKNCISDYRTPKHCFEIDCDCVHGMPFLFFFSCFSEHNFCQQVVFNDIDLCNAVQFIREMFIWNIVRIFRLDLAMSQLKPITNACSPFAWWSLQVHFGYSLYFKQHFILFGFGM